MQNPDTVFGAVYDVLKKDVDSRNSDRDLICKVYEQYGVDTTAPFVEVIHNKDIPAMETITRCRRKAQNNFKDLKPTKTVRRFRAENEAEMRAFALDNGVI